MNYELLLQFLNESHCYDYAKIESPIEEFLLNHVLKFLKKETKVVLQYPVATICGNFRADIALIYKEKTVLLECDGKAFHTKDLDDWYDEWRDTVILVQRKANSIYRIKGADIYNNIYAVIAILSFFDEDLFDLPTIAKLPTYEICGTWYKKCIYLNFSNLEGNEVPYTVQVKRKNIASDFDSYWLKYFLFSMLNPGKTIHELIHLFQSEEVETKHLIKELNEKYPELKLVDAKQLLL